MRRAKLPKTADQNGAKKINPAAVATLAGFLCVLIGAGIVVARSLMPQNAGLPAGLENLPKLADAPAIPNDPIELAFGTDKPDWNMTDFNVEETVNNPSVYQNVTKEVARQINLGLPFVPDNNIPAAPFFLSAKTQTDSARAQHCMSLAVYFEAASETSQGQHAVAQVVINRLRHPAWPHTVCGVVFQGSERRTGCQFSFTCDGALSRRPSGRAWLLAQGVASAALNGFVLPDIGHATHYHTDWVAPYWAPSLRKLKQIGTHIFYTWKGGGGNPRAFRDAYQGTEAWPRLAALSAPHLGAPDAVQAVIDNAAGGGVTPEGTLGAALPSEIALGAALGREVAAPNLGGTRGENPIGPQVGSRGGQSGGNQNAVLGSEVNARLESEAARSIASENQRPRPQISLPKPGPNGLMAEPDLNSVLPKYNIPESPTKRASQTAAQPAEQKRQEKRARAMDGL